MLHVNFFNVFRRCRENSGMILNFILLPLPLKLWSSSAINLILFWRWLCWSNWTFFSHIYIGSRWHLDIQTVKLFYVCNWTKRPLLFFQFSVADDLFRFTLNKSSVLATEAVFFCPCSSEMYVNLLFYFKGFHCCSDTWLKSIFQFIAYTLLLGEKFYLETSRKVWWHMFPRYYQGLIENNL